MPSWAPCSLKPTMPSAANDCWTKWRQHPNTSCDAEWRETIENTDTETPLQMLQVPALYVAAQEPLGDLARIRAAGVTIGQTVGAGHFNHLDVPAQVNSMIERFIALNVSVSA